MGVNKLPDITFLKGIIAVVVGVMLIMFSYSIIVRMACFLIGLCLMSYGFRILNSPALNLIFLQIKEFYYKMFFKF